MFEIHNSDASPDTEWQRLEIRFAHWGMKLFQEGFGAQRQGARVVVTALEAAWRVVRASKQTEAPNRSPCGSVLL